MDKYSFAFTGGNFQLAEVRSLDDYYKSGRVKVRIYGLQDDEQNVKDDNLIEAIPLQDITSAATGKVGKIPTGLVVGSRVMIGYLANDPEKKSPFIFGSFARGAMPNDRSPQTATAGREGTKKDSVGVDVPSGGNPTPQGKNQAAKNPHNKAIGGKPFNPNKDRYNNAQYVENGTGPEDIKTARSKFAPNADKPTTASGDASKKLPEIIKQVDPAAASQALKAMFTALAMVRAMMNSSSPAPRRKTITDALSGALCILSKEFGFDRVVFVMNRALENDGLAQISEDYRDIVKNAVADLITKAVQFGAKNIPVKEYPVYKPVLVSRIVLPGLIVDVVPDLYKQMYYPVNSDPYPGYVHWVSPDGKTNVFTARKPNEKIYTDAEEEIYATCEIELAEDLRPYFIKKDLILTAVILNRFLQKQDNNVQNNGMEKAMGKNAGVNIMGLMQQLLGLLGTAINLSKNLHLPNSVLNQGAINQTMEKYAKGMAVIKKMKQDSMPAFNGPSPLGALGGLAGGLGGLGGLAGNLGGIAGSLGGLAGVASGLASGNIGAITGVVSQISGINSATINIAANLVNKIVS